MELRKGPGNERTPPAFRLDMREVAGSLGDLGTLLPLGMGLVLVCGFDAGAVLFCVGLFYVLSGLVFRVPVPVQPMKVISAYAIANSLTPLQVSTAGLWMGLLLLLLAGSGASRRLKAWIPGNVVRGVQVAVGLTLLFKGLGFMLGRTTLQRSLGGAEPFLSFHLPGALPPGLLLGLLSLLLARAMSENKVLPGGLLVVLLGTGVGLLLGKEQGSPWSWPSPFLPSLLPYGLPHLSTVGLALVYLALPQMPMTVGNALLAQADLNAGYFGEAAGRRQTPRALALSMGLANVAAALVGGMPMCHGAGGLAAHYRFGARTAASNLVIGSLCLVLAIWAGNGAIRLLGLLPFGVLGALLVMAGMQLARVALHIRHRGDALITALMLCLALTTNLALAFMVGIVASLWLKRKGTAKKSDR